MLRRMPDRSQAMHTPRSSRQTFHFPAISLTFAPFTGSTPGSIWAAKDEADAHDPAPMLRQG
jgi:hypothetical protein